MFKTRTIVLLAAAILIFAGCTQTGNTPAPLTAGPMDPNSVTVFTSRLAHSPDSVSGCIVGASPGGCDPSRHTHRRSNGKAEDC